MQNISLINVAKVCDCTTSVRIPTLLAVVNCPSCNQELELSEKYRYHIVEYYTRLGVYTRQKKMLDAVYP